MFNVRRTRGIAVAIDTAYSGIGNVCTYASKVSAFTLGLRGLPYSGLSPHRMAYTKENLPSKSALQSRTQTHHDGQVSCHSGSPARPTRYLSSDLRVAGERLLWLQETCIWSSQVMQRRLTCLGAPCSACMYSKVSGMSANLPVQSEPAPASPHAAAGGPCGVSFCFGRHVGWDAGSGRLGCFG
jgi:hypothetical protein